MRLGLLVTLFEALGRDGQPKFNAHVIVIMPDAKARDRLIESLPRSSVYGRYVDAKRIVDWYRLTKYLCKEATPTAWFAAGKSFRRIRGSIPLGDLGGDRVVLSRDLRDVLIATGRIEPFQRTYAKRQPSPSPRAFSSRRPRSHMADRAPLEPTPTPAAGRSDRAVHGGDLCTCDARAPSATDATPPVVADSAGPPVSRLLAPAVRELAKAQDSGP
jgi:hypothetical protein